MAGSWRGSVGDGIVDAEEEWIGAQTVEIADAGETQAGAGGSEEEGSGDGNCYGRGAEVKEEFHGQPIFVGCPFVFGRAPQAGPLNGVDGMSNREECRCELIS